MNYVNAFQVNKKENASVRISDELTDAPAGVERIMKTFPEM